MKAAMLAVAGGQGELLISRDAHKSVVAGVPLLDETAELLGQDERAAWVRSMREQARRIACAQGVLNITADSREL